MKDGHFNDWYNQENTKETFYKYQTNLHGVNTM